MNVYHFLISNGSSGVKKTHSIIAGLEALEGSSLSIKFKNVRELRDEYQCLGKMQCPSCGIVYAAFDELSTGSGVKIVGCPCGHQLFSDDSHKREVIREGEDFKAGF